MKKKWNNSTSNASKVRSPGGGGIEGAVNLSTLPNSDPINIDLLRDKHPETAHPDRYPVRFSSRLWSRPEDLVDHWSSDPGIEFLDKWFSVAKICQYFRTRSPVTMPDIDG